jgi:AraC family transcriptional regulator
MRYVRGRRLSEAARALAGGAPDILAVALDAGYGSHEAFTRAFRDQFGMTPEQFRGQPDRPDIEFVEPILMDDQTSIELAAPRIVAAEPMLLAGIGQRYEYDAMGGIPGQWQRFNAHAGTIPGEVTGAAYGVCTNGDQHGLDYICAVEVRDFSDVDPDFTRLRIPAQRYAVFAHPGDIMDIRRVIRTICGEWLPKSGMEMADAPSLERYGREFDPETGKGGFEIWLPVRG